MADAGSGGGALGLTQVAAFTEASASGLFGRSVAAHGDTVLVGDPGANQVVAYRRGASGWRRRLVSGPSDVSGFGHVVATGPAGDLVGAWRRVTREVGAVYRLAGAGVTVLARSDDETVVGDAVAVGQGGLVYTERTGARGRVAILSGGARRQILPPPGEEDYFGISLAASGTRLAVLAPAAGRGGAVLVYDLQTGALLERLQPRGGASPEDGLAMAGESVIRTGSAPRVDRPVMVWSNGRARALDLAADRSAIAGGHGFFLFSGAGAGVLSAPASAAVEIVDLASGTGAGQLDPGEGTPAGVAAGQGTLAVVTRLASGGAATQIYNVT